jgi:hypothetical protein
VDYSEPDYERRYVRGSTMPPPLAADPYAEYRDYRDHRERDALRPAPLPTSVPPIPRLYSPPRQTHRPPRSRGRNRPGRRRR